MRVWLVSGVVLAAAAIIFVFSANLVVRNAPDLSGTPAFDAEAASFADFKGWASDDVYDALEAFVRSCGALLARADDEPANMIENLGVATILPTFSGTVGDWRASCLAAVAQRDRLANAPDRSDQARAFFEERFAPFRVLNRYDGDAGSSFQRDGLFTGYYEPIYSAARQPDDTFSAPVYARPADLVEIDLGLFREDLKGRRLAGRIDGARLVPYADHQAINSGAVDGRAAVLAYMDPNDLLFLQIQGSGQLRFPDGGALRVGYAAQNGHEYTAVGRVLVDQGAMPLADVTMQSIRAWLDDAPAGMARSVREANRSYVFFREIDAPADLGPLGAQGLPLTAERSLAVDRRYHMLGAPVWIDLEPVEAGAAPIRRLVIAQDTGGAIKGPVRGDLFWGAGPEAGRMAGVMKSRGEMYVLLPRALADRLPKVKRT